MTSYALGHSGRSFHKGYHAYLQLLEGPQTYVLKFDPSTANLSWMTATGCRITKSVNLTIAPEWYFHVVRYDEDEEVEVLPLLESDYF